METKTISKQLAAWIIAIVGIFSLTACDEDWWNGWDGYSDVTGQWRIVEVSGGWNVPYRQGDYWKFHSNGDFDSDGYGNLHERGYWRMSGRTIEFSFPPNNYTAMSAYVSTYDRSGYMTLRVNDYDNNTSYTLRLTRYY